jgi:hypothetical protein
MPMITLTDSSFLSSASSFDTFQRDLGQIKE